MSSCVQKIAVLAAACGVAVFAAAVSGGAAQAQEPPASPEAEKSGELPSESPPAVDASADATADRAAEDAALRMVQLRLESCEQRQPAPCPAASPAQPGLRATAALWGSSYQYTQPWNLSSVSAGTLLLGVDSSSGGLWLATGLSQTGLRYQSSDFHQATHLLGATKRWGDTVLAATAGHLSTSSSTSDGTWLAIGEAIWRPGDFGADLAVSYSRYPDFWRLQVEPTLLVRLGPKLDLGVGAMLQKGRGALRTSGRAGVTLRLGDRFELSGSGWYGRRQYTVEAGGLSVWSNDDLLWGGYRVGAAVHTGPLTWDLTWLHDLGQAQSGQTHDYSILGATAGVRWAF